MWQSNFEAINRNPFKTDFLSRFYFDPEKILLTDTVLTELDNQVMNYEATVPFNVREYLINRNEILSSLAISKAEQTNLLKETDATEIQRRLNVDQNYDPMNDQDVKTEKERYDRLELANIMKCYRYVSDNAIKAGELSVDLLKDLHSRLSKGLDAFSYLPEFSAYFPGRLRNNNLINVSGGPGRSYKPVDYQQVEENIDAALAYYKANPSIANLNLLNISLYAVHPFNNGNKRLCRILEHALLRDLGLNKLNAYSHIYYYHKQIGRFYDELLRSLLGLSFMPAINFSREAIFFSELSVLKFGLEQKRKSLALQGGFALYEIYKHLIKNKSMRYKELRELNQDMAEATFAKYLATGVSDGILKKEESGKAVFYSINLDLQEERLAREVIESQADQLLFIPETYASSLYDALKHDRIKRIGATSDTTTNLLL